jgi:hypothetical protein
MLRDFVRCNQYHNHNRNSCYPPRFPHEVTPLSSSLYFLKSHPVLLLQVEVKVLFPSDKRPWGEVIYSPPNGS